MGWIPEMLPALHATAAANSFSPTKTERASIRGESRIAQERRLLRRHDSGNDPGMAAPFGDVSFKGNIESQVGVAKTLPPKRFIC